MSKTLKKHGFLKKIIISRDLKVLRHHNHRPYLTQINYEANEWNVIRFCLEQQFSIHIWWFEFARLVTQATQCSLPALKRVHFGEIIL